MSLTKDEEEHSTGSLGEASMKVKKFTLNIENNSLGKTILNFSREGYLKIGWTKEAIGFASQCEK